MKKNWNNRGYKVSEVPSETRNELVR